MNKSLNVLKVVCFPKNIDENPQTPQEFGVKGIPTLMLFNNGKLIDSKLGSMSKSLLIEWIESCLNK